MTKRQTTEKQRTHTAWKSGPGALVELADKADIVEVSLFVWVKSIRLGV